LDDYTKFLTPSREGSPIGSETQKGIVRLASREDHECCAEDCAAQPKYVREQLLQYGGLPLLSIIWETSSLDKFGYLRANVNSDPVSRAAFPEAAAEVRRRYDAGDAGVVTDAKWLAELAASGMCAKFSIGDGATTFRIPFFDVNRASMAVAGGALGPGDYRADQMRPITGGPVQTAMAASGGALTPVP
jgi:hypothetical protein